MMECKYTLGEKEYRLKCEISPDSCGAEIDGEKCDFDYRIIDNHCLSLMGKDGNFTLYFARNKDEIHIFLEGKKYILKTVDADSRYASGAGGSSAEKGLVTTPMPGTIIKFLVNEGDEVEIDQGLVIVEAMKMENEIRSTVRARVKKVNFKPGDAVDVHQSIIDLEEIKSD